mmetsp:Transcript_62305/g.163596  ORF Transcript_62305/g.163596 Transcript_62305/m.163596 type:complete len:616 (+) Transcript_62305:129-1976(+)
MSRSYGANLRSFSTGFKDGKLTTCCSVVGQVASLVHGRAVRAVADVVDEALQRRQQRGAGLVRVGADGLRVVDGVAGHVQGGAVTEVADVVAVDRLRQVGAGLVRVGLDVLRVVDFVAGQVVRSAVREVAHVVAVHELAVSQRGLHVDGGLRRNVVVHAARNGALLLGRTRAHEGGRRSLLLPVEAGRLHGGLARVAELLLPARVDLVRILLEGQEGALDILVRLGKLDHAIRQAHVAVGARLPELPGLLTLAAGRGALLRAVLVAEGATAGREDHVRVAQVLEEGREAERVHAARDDGRGLRHALPLLVVVRAIGLVLLQHVRNALVRGITLHLTEGHGANMDAAGTHDAGELRVHEGRVAALRLRARHGTVAGTVVVQELLREVAAGNGDGGAAGHVTVNEEGAALPKRAELGEAVLATGDHLRGVIRRDVRGEELGAARLLDARAHGLHDLGDALVHLAEDLVALGLVVLDEVTPLPEGVARLAEGLRLQAELGLDDGADDEAAGGGAAAQDAPHVNDVAGRAVEEAQVGRGEVDVVDLAVLDVAHALVVADAQGQHGAHHRAAVDDVAVEEQVRVGNLHLLVFRVDIASENVAMAEGKRFERGKAVGHGWR